MFRKIALAFTAIVLSLGIASAADEYRVKRGNNLSWIAKQHGVEPSAMIYANESMLQANYERRCSRLSDEFRSRTEKRDVGKGGLYYCNDGKRRPYANTLNPGMRLVIPETSAPISVERTVREIRGKRIAVVVDETGSTSNKRQQIGEYYLAALKKHEREIVGIYLYTGKAVRKIDAVGVTDLSSVMHNRGGRENTHEALRRAADDRPDVIVLLTDEPGDDWQWHLVSALPTVIAHCLPEGGVAECRVNLQELVRQVGKGSRYIEGLNEPAPITRR
ncbi:MAG TPA: LysM peptidoglycan-binding domain-containing protein [Candidatus Paceibacterota bacterium]